MEWSEWFGVYGGSGSRQSWRSFTQMGHGVGIEGKASECWGRGQGHIAAMKGVGIGWGAVSFYNIIGYLDDPSTNKPTATIRPTLSIHPMNCLAVTIFPCDILTPVRSIQVFFVHPDFELDGLSHVT